jgi:hypothetical protein
VSPVVLHGGGYVKGHRKCMGRAVAAARGRAYIVNPVSTAGGIGASCAKACPPTLGVFQYGFVDFPRWHSAWNVPRGCRHTKQSSDTMPSLTYSANMFSLSSVYGPEWKQQHSRRTRQSPSVVVPHSLTLTERRVSAFDELGRQACGVTLAPVSLDHTHLSSAAPQRAKSRCRCPAP